MFYLQNLNQKEVWNDFDVVDIKLPALNSAPESAAIDTCGFNPLQGNSLALTDPLKAISEFVNEIGQKSLWVNNLSISNDVLTAKATERATLPEVVESDYLTRASGLLLAYGGIDKVFWKYQPQSGQPAVIALQSFSNLSKTLSSNAGLETVADSAEFKHCASIITANSPSSPGASRAAMKPSRRSSRAWRAINWWLFHPTRNP